MQRFFITGTGTGIGKTLVMTSACWQLSRAGKKVTALKPIISGFDISDMQNDTARILQSLGRRVTAEAIHEISPWRFAAPLSPHMAAAREGKNIALDEVVKFCGQQQGDAVLAEGAGGVMSPINNHATMLDVMEALSWPVILVAGSYLGALSHTLTALEALRARRITVTAVVVSESEHSAMGLTETKETVEKFVRADVPVILLPRVPNRDEQWKNTPPLDWIRA